MKLTYAFTTKDNSIKNFRRLNLNNCSKICLQKNVKNRKNAEEKRNGFVWK